jgi:hypothetical protein
MTEHKGHQAKRKKRNTGLAVTLVLLIACIAVAAVFFLMGQSSAEKKRYEAELQQRSQEFTDSLLAELDRIDVSGAALAPAGKNPEAAAENQAAGEGDPATSSAPTSTEAPPEIISEAEKQAVADELARLEDEKKRQALQILSVAYSKALAAQKQEAFRMADGLITQAKADWKALGSSGKADPTKRGEMVSEYLAKSKVLEDQMDASFEALIQKMNEQLSAEGIDPAALIAQYRAEYKKIKEENKGAMMSRALEAVKK